MAKNDNNFNIITRFYDGQKDAVEQMVAEYRQGLELFILGYVHDSQVAEDVASDAFVRLIVKKPDIRELKYFKTYLYTVAKNLAIEHIRKRKRFLPLNEDAPSHQNVEKDVILKEKKESVLSAINQLAGDYRSVLFLRYYEEMSVEEVARVMKKNKKQVENIVYRAKKALKKELEKEVGLSENK